MFVSPTSSMGMQRFRTSWLAWLLLCLAGLTVALAPFASRLASSRPAIRHFRIEANQYSYTPSELQVNPGDTVIIDLVSTDTVHGLYVDGYGVSAQADPGAPATLKFTADRPGTFRFRCNVTCGALHPFIIGKLMVGPNIALIRGLGLVVVGELGLVLVRRRAEAAHHAPA